jgi:hypothetical protein
MHPILKTGPAIYARYSSKRQGERSIDDEMRRYGSDASVIRFAWILVLVVAAGCRFDLPTVSDSAPADAFPNLRTDDIFMQFCTLGQPGDPSCPFNVIPLDNLISGGIPGAKINFAVQDIGTGVHISHLTLIPGPMGAYIERPLFVSIPVDPAQKPIVDRSDRFHDVKMSLSANATPEMQVIGAGATTFLGFPASNKIAVFFAVARPL